MMQNKKTSYAVQDVQNYKEFLYDNWNDALDAYAKLGNREGKSLSIGLSQDSYSKDVPENLRYQGRFRILKQENGKDFWFNTYMKPSDVEATKEIFAGTEVEDLISAAESYIKHMEKNRIESAPSKNDGRNPGNIESLKELNEVINNVVNFIVDYSTQHTLSGNRYMGYDDVCHLISEEDYNKYLKLIAFELEGREEVLELEIEDGELDVTYGLAYCPYYQWCEGDEAVFGMSEEELEKSYQYEPVAQPLSLSRLAEIGDRAIPFILSQFDNGLEELQNSLGMTEEELSRMNILNDVPNLHDNEKTNQGPQQPFLYGYAVKDPRSIVQSLNRNLENVLQDYKDLGNVDGKTLNFFLADDHHLENPVCLLKRENGQDLLTSLNDLPPIPQVYEAYTHLESLRSGNRLEAKIKTADVQIKQMAHTENKEKLTDKERG